MSTCSGSFKTAAVMHSGESCIPSDMTSNGERIALRLTYKECTLFSSVS